MTMLFFYLTLALGVSFLCSLFEAVILTVSHAYAAGLAKKGSSTGRLLKRLKEDIDSSLAAILTLNTIAHTIGAAGVGAEVLKVFGDSYVAVGSVILTILILVLSEIIPKTLGATYWRVLAPAVARGIQVFIWITYPFVKTFEALSRWITPKSAKEKKITRGEIAFAADIGQTEGSLSARENRVIKNLLSLRDITVSEVMTPRTVVYALEKKTPLCALTGEKPFPLFSRIPVYDGTKDQVIGMVFRFDLLQAIQNMDSSTCIETLLKPIHHVPPSLALSEALSTFLQRREHLFAVIGEHGELCGIVTLEDTLETLLGVEILDEFDSVADMRRFAAEKWAKRRSTYAKYEPTTSSPNIEPT